MTWVRSDTPASLHVCCALQHLWRPSAGGYLQSGNQRPRVHVHRRHLCSPLRRPPLGHLLPVRRHLASPGLREGTRLATPLKPYPVD